MIGRGFTFDLNVFHDKLVRRFSAARKSFSTPAKSRPAIEFPRDQHQFHRLGQFMLMLPETFAQQPPRPVAGDRVADAFARDHAQFRRCAVRQALPVGDQAAQRQPFALLPHPRKIAVLTESRGAAQPQASASGIRPSASVWGRAGMNTRLNRGQAFAAHAAAVGQRGLAALGGIAVEKSMLPFAADF